MVNSREPSSNPSRTRILDAARAEFAEKGFDGARVEAIAQRAEVNKALIYYYFKSKDELLQELLRSFLEERRSRSPKGTREGEFGTLPHQAAQFDVEFLFQKRDFLRIALMEDLKSSKDGVPGPGTIMKHWLDGLVETREEYVQAGYRFRYTPRVVTAMYFFHLLPILSYCTMGETLAKATGMEFETVQKEFLKLLMELNTQQFHAVFGDSATDPTPEVALPGLEPIPPSEEMRRVKEAFREGEVYDTGRIAAILSEIVGDPSRLLDRMTSLRLFQPAGEGTFRWCVPTPEARASSPSSPHPPQDHLRITATEQAALVAKHMPQGRLESFPLKEKARVALVDHLSRLFSAGRIYTEREVDGILKDRVADHSKARRYLVDYGYLRRTPDGSRYWTWDGEQP